MADLDHLKIVVESESSGVESRLLGIANALHTLRSSVTDKSSKNLGKTTDALKTLCKTLNEHLTEAVVSRFERLAEAMERLAAIGRLKTGVQISGKNALADIETVAAGEDTASNGAKKRADAEKEVAKQLKEQQKVLNGLKQKYTGIFRALGRIALYRLLRSIIKMFTESLSKGLENVYQYSKEVETNFHNVRDDIKASGLYLTNALGAAASSLIEDIAPVVIQLLDATAEMLNHISEMFAFFRGDAEYTKAIKGNFHDSNEEAKKLKNTLLGFDEINKLNGNNGSGLGSDYSGYFVQEKVDTGRAVGTTSIFGSIAALVGGGIIARVLTDVKKLVSVIGGGSAGGAASGTLSGALNGVLGLVGKISSGLGSVLTMHIFDVQFQNYLNAEELDEKIISQIGACFAAVGSVALAGVAGGSVGIAIAIPTILALGIKDLLLNDETRGKINDKIKSFASFISAGGTSDHESAAQNFANLAEDIDKYADDVGKSTSFLERVDAWFKLQSNALYDITTGGINWADGGISQVSSPAEDTFNFGKSVFNLVVDGESIAGAVIKSITGANRRN